MNGVGSVMGVRCLRPLWTNGPPPSFQRMVDSLKAALKALPVQFSLALEIQALPKVPYSGIALFLRLFQFQLCIYIDIYISRGHSSLSFFFSVSFSNDHTQPGRAPQRQTDRQCRRPRGRRESDRRDEFPRPGKGGLYWSPWGAATIGERRAGSAWGGIGRDRAPRWEPFPRSWAEPVPLARAHPPSCPPSGGKGCRLTRNRQRTAVPRGLWRRRCRPGQMQSRRRLNVLQSL
ncbi:hypothetical protein GGR56DRAFT_120746 [Xylariaceae sp. FL0804]|nr:hypothetical protein GGR56DRAFT_120746 [Xylariaceae sp. FL0804]